MSIAGYFDKSGTPRRNPRESGVGIRYSGGVAAGRKDLQLEIITAGDRARSLADGNLVVTSAEIYDPVLGAFRPAGE